ncbi:hypothetical protein BKA64DRAFT_681871 [Cadophora sp. MPI-SDFR-AT-0126]|nr:hypothetical protein BKA64DRAFT_681871 [Leotiomycetes sp. MPI-SDFR-AT-0126]
MGNMRESSRYQEPQPHAPSHPQSTPERHNHHQYPQHCPKTSEPSETSDSESGTSVDYPSSMDYPDEPASASDFPTREQMDASIPGPFYFSPNAIRNPQLHPSPLNANLSRHRTFSPSHQFINLFPPTFNPYSQPVPSMFFPISQSSVALQYGMYYPSSDLAEIARRRLAQTGRHWSANEAHEPVTWWVGDGHFVPVAGDPMGLMPSSGYGLGFGCRGDGF